MDHDISIRNYKPLLIKVGTAGAYSEDMVYEDNVISTLRDYGLWIKHSPYTIATKSKNVVVQTWKDEDGDDIFLPETGITHESQDVEFTFVYFRADGMATVNIQRFIDRIKGRWLKIYDTYTGIGRKGCCYMEADQDPEFKRRPTLDYKTTRDTVIFNVKFKVNCPDLDVPLSEFNEEE